jgi:hypothetical protein
VGEEFFYVLGDPTKVEPIQGQITKDEEAFKVFWVVKGRGFLLKGELRKSALDNVEVATNNSIQQGDGTRSRPNLSTDYDLDATRRTNGTQTHQDASRRTKTHQDAPRRTKTHRDAPRRTIMPLSV